MNKALAILLSVATTGSAYAGRSGGDVLISSGSFAAQSGGGGFAGDGQDAANSPGGEPGEPAHGKLRRAMGGVTVNRFPARMLWHQT